MANGKKIEFMVCGLTWKYYVPLLAVILLASYMGVLDKGLVGSVPWLMAVGGLFFWLGNNIPIVNNYLAGGCLLPLFGASLMKFLGLIPDGTIVAITNLMKGADFQNFFVAGVLVGSIFCMDRKVLLGATARYIPAILISQLFALGFATLAGIITGAGAGEAILNIGAPCLSGGSSGAMTTLPATYTQLAGVDMTGLGGRFLCYASIANVLAVFLAAVCGNLMANIPGWSGNGAILAKGNDNEKVAQQVEKAVKRPTTSADYAKLGAGIFIAAVIFEGGSIISHFVPAVAGIAWAIIIAIILKCVGVVPEEICDCSTYWMNFLLKAMLPLLIAGIGVCSLNITDLTSYFTPAAFIIILVTVLGCFIGAMLGGKLAGLYPYETGVTAGLCSCNIGGSGDIAVLTAAGRMNLLAFASISTRIGGALMIIWVSLLFQVLR